MFMIAYLASRQSDVPEELRTCNAPNLAGAVRTGTTAVQNMAFAKGRFRNTVVGFIVEGPDGEELYRWYEDVLCEKASLGN